MINLFQFSYNFSEKSKTGLKTQIEDISIDEK